MERRELSWITFRALLFFSGVSLVGYLGYRYLIAGAPEAGTVYGTIFPASLLLAAAAIFLAFRPDLFQAVDGLAGWGLRAGLGLFGAVWMGTGLLCVQSLAAGVAASPFFGTLDFMHMLSHHVVIPAGIGVLVAVPGRVLDWAGEGPAVPARSSEARRR